MWSLFRRNSSFAVFFLPPAVFSSISFLPRQKRYGRRRPPAPSVQTLQSVEAGLRRLHAVLNKAQRRVCRMPQRSLQRWLIGLRDGSEHPVRQIVVRTGLGADADLHARELVGSQRGNDRFDAVVSAGGAAWPDTDLSDREGDVVEQDDDPLRRKLIIACSLLASPEAFMNVCGRTSRSFCPCQTALAHSA